MAKLKPCDCGDTHHMICSNVFDEMYWVECLNRRCYIKGPSGRTKEAAIAAWNTHVTVREKE